MIDLVARHLIYYPAPHFGNMHFFSFLYFAGIKYFHIPTIFTMYALSEDFYIDLYHYIMDQYIEKLIKG